MKDVGIVQGNSETAIPLIVGKTTVYEHTDIEKLEKDKDGNPVDNLYQYHEYQYSLQEYIKKQAENNEELAETVDDLLTNILPEIIEGGV